MASRADCRIRADVAAQGVKAAFLDYATLAAEDLDPAALTSLLPDLALYGDTTAAELPGRLRDAEIVMINKIPLTGTVLGLAPRLKLICLAATGTDNVALETAASTSPGVVRPIGRDDYLYVVMPMRSGK